METTLGKRISSLRKEKELTQEGLAGLLGISPQAVSKWENDLTCPDINLLPKLSHTLGVSVDELLTGEAEKPPVTVLPTEERKALKDMLLKITVDSKDGDKVRINIPMALVQVAIDTGIDINNISDDKNLKKIDLTQIVELVRQGVVGNLVDIETGDGDTVHIFVE